MSRGSGTLGDFVPAPAMAGDLEQQARGFDVQQDAMAFVQGRGIAVPTPPAGFHGEMPLNITSLDDDELGDHLSKQSQYIGYLEVELAAAESKKNSAEAQLEWISAKIALGLKATGIKMSEADKKAGVTTDERVKEAKQRALYTESVYKLLKKILENAQRNWDTISRRITQRGQEVERLKRENNVAGVVAAYPPRRFNRPGQGQQ